jgi:hypothetical protein
MRKALDGPLFEGLESLDHPPNDPLKEGDSSPTLGHLKAYGCRAWVHIPSEIRVQSAKFSERALKGVLIGYEG